MEIKKFNHDNQIYRAFLYVNFPFGIIGPISVPTASLT